MISIHKAIRMVSRETRGLVSERVSITDALGRTLAEDIIADCDLPPFHRSQMDGYAVKAADIAPKVNLRIVGESAAGRGWHRKLQKGEAVRIMTGAPVPDGADTVAKLEIAQEVNGCVTIGQPVTKGVSIVRRGSEVKKGRVVIRSGQRVTPNNVASIAAFGYSKVRVAKRPRIAILATGREIVEVSKKPRRDQIRNSNSVMLKALCEKAGAMAEIVPPAGDDLSDLKAKISRSAKRADIMVITGGVSVGKYDLTKAALQELGATIRFEKLRLKPGKPAVFARLGDTFVFALPGNPVSAVVTFYLLVRSAIMLMQGAHAPYFAKGSAVLATNAKADNERDTFLPATLGTDGEGRLTATSLRSQGSSDLVGFSEADSLIYLPAGSAKTAGDIVEVQFL